MAIYNSSSFFSDKFQNLLRPIDGKCLRYTNVHTRSNEIEKKSGEIEVLIFKFFGQISNL